MCVCVRQGEKEVKREKDRGRERDRENHHAIFKEKSKNSTPD